MQDNINPQELVDIRDIHIDKNMPKQERISEFVRQIKNPYHFRYAKLAVTVNLP